MKKICVGLVLGVCKNEEMAADMMYVTSSLTRCMFVSLNDCATATGQYPRVICRCEEHCSLSTPGCNDRECIC